MPISVCQYAIQENCIDELQLFTWLKLNCNHRVKIDHKIRFRIVKELNITRQTLNARIVWLLKHKWISYNSKRGSWHLNSFRIIHRKTNSEITKGVIWENYNIQIFKAFVYAGIIGYYAKRKYFNDHFEIRIRDKEQNQVRMKKAHPSKSLAPYSLNLPLEYLAKAINTPKSTVQKMKALAEEQFFIEVENNFAETNLSVPELLKLRRFAKDAPGINRFVLIAGKVKEQLPDKISLNINFRTKRILKQNELKNRYRK
jgi:hypothetical protein